MEIKIIYDYEAGKRVKAIECDLEMTLWTISAILKDKVKDVIKSSLGFKAIITRQRKGLINEMEKFLAI